MNDVQRSLLRLVLEIDDVCEKHNLSYYLGGGCLVGAMRNKGFLPWDDDLDIHMTREDAFVLLDLFHKGMLPEDRVVVSYHDYPDAPLLHWRYEDVTTTVSLRSTYTTTVPQGQFVDIFVLNPAPAQGSDRDRFVEDFVLYWDLFSNNVIDSRRSDAVVRRYKKWTLLRKWGFLERYMHKKFRRRLFELPEDASDEYSILSPWAPRPFWPKSFFGTPRRVPFEDASVCVPSRAEEMLCFAYGSSWIEVPDAQERGSHTFIIDLDFPYSDYMRIIDSLDNRFEGGRLSWAWKDDWISGLSDRNYVNPRTRELRLGLVALSAERLWEERQQEIQAACDAGDYFKIKTLFSDYIKAQFGDNTSYWGLFIPVRDDVLRCVWYAQYMLGDYAHVQKVLRRRRVASSSEFPRHLLQLEELCEEADALMSALWSSHDFSTASRIVENGLRRERPSVIFYRSWLALHMGFEDLPSSLQRCFEFVSDAVRKYPEDGELRYWLAKCYSQLGDPGSARKNYLIASGKSANGLVATWARDALLDGIER